LLSAIARRLEFPEDLEVGNLWVTRGASLLYRGPARGTIAVPAGASVELSGNCPVRGLNALRPDAIDILSLPKKSATDEDMRRIAHLTRLRELYLSKSIHVTDAGLAALARMRELRDLNIYWSAVTDAGLAALMRMVNLEYLHLGLTRIKGPGLACLMGMHRLRRLSIENTDVDDASLHYLARLTSLKRLALWGTRVSTPGLQSLRAALPNTYIHMTDPGQRLARELGPRAVLRILVRRLRPDAPAPEDPETRLTELLPEGSVITQWRRERGAPACKVNIKMDDRFTLAAILGRTRGDLRIVTSDGYDFWVPWLRKRTGDRRRAPRRRPSMARAQVPERVR